MVTQSLDQQLFWPLSRLVTCGRNEIDIGDARQGGHFAKGKPIRLSQKPWLRRNAVSCTDGGQNRAQIAAGEGDVPREFGTVQGFDCKASGDAAFLERHQWNGLTV